MQDRGQRSYITVIPTKGGDRLILHYAGKRKGGGRGPQGGKYEWRTITLPPGFTRDRLLGVLDAADLNPPEDTPT